MSEAEAIKKEYELSFLLKSPEAESELINVLNQHQTEILERSSITDVRLAYPIKKQTLSYFGFCRFWGLPEDAEKLREVLSLKPAILRFLLITPPIRTRIESAPRPLKAVSPIKPSSPAESEIRPLRQDVLSNELLEEKLEEILK